MGSHAINDLAAPSAPNDAARKADVDAAVASLVKADGSVPLTGTWNLGGQSLINVGNLDLAAQKAIGLGTFTTLQESSI
jgi:hypothetical protein